MYSSSFTLCNTLLILFPGIDAPSLHSVDDEPSMSGIFFMETEIWKPIMGTFGQYEISNLGRIKKLFVLRNNTKHYCKADKVYRGSNSRGYKVINMKFRGEMTPKLVHRLIAIAFIPNPHRRPCINHIDGKKDNNRIINLEWCTRRQNILHAQRMGLVPKRYRGVDAACVKLTEKQVMHIYYSKESGLKLAAQYGVAHSTIYKIKNKETWKHIHT